MVGSTLNFAFDIVSLAEERVPVVEHFLVVVREVLPIRPAFFFLQR